MHSSLFVVFASLLIVTSGNIDPSTEELLSVAKKTLPDAVNLAKNSLGSHVGGDIFSKMPTSLDELGEHLPTGVNASALPSIEEGEELMKKKCLRNGKNDSYDILMQAKEDMQYCMKDLVDIETLQAEIAAHKPNGDLDVVFKKYCRKMPTLKSCVNNFTSAMEQCLDTGEKILKPIILNITESLDRFICYKEGDRIALFIAEGGPECLNDKQEAIQHCMNETIISKNIPADVQNLDFNSIPVFKLGESECRDINRLQLCVVTELEKCSEPTPANIVDSLFNFIRQTTPCAPYKLEQTNSSSSLSVNSWVLFSSLVLFLLGVSLHYH